MKKADIQAINLLLTFLTTQPALPDNWRPDGVIWCGNSQPSTGRQAAELAEHYQVPLILSGGQGHATQDLLNQLPKNNQQVTEAASVHSWLQATLPTVPKIMLESQSTNSGENAQNSLKISQQLHWQQLLLIQDPLLQLRTRLTFTHQAPQLTFKTWSPQLQLVTWEPFVLNDSRYHWLRPYFIGLILGELSRLANTPTGYGPAGRNFIDSIELTATVLQAKKQLQKLNLPTIR